MNERIETVKNVIQAEISEEQLIVPEMHRRALYAVTHALQEVTARMAFTDTSAKFIITIPEGSIYDVSENDGKTLSVEGIVNNLKTNDNYKRIAKIDNVHVSGGAEYTVTMKRAQWEYISLYAINLMVGDHIFRKIL